MIIAPADEDDEAPAVAAAPPLSDLKGDLEGGLRCEGGRWADALRVEQCYQLKSAELLQPREGEEDADFDKRPKRASHITRTVVRKLARPLYARGPTRRLPKSPGADKWLQAIYGQVNVNAAMGAANRAAILHHVAAIQAEPTGDPARPIRLVLWKAHELAAWHARGDEAPWAVAVRDRVPEPTDRDRVRHRIRVWTAAETQTFLSEPVPRSSETPGESFAAQGPAEPHGLGRLPFAIVRNEPMESEFWEGGIGKPLADCNLEINRELSDTAQHAQEFLNPRLFLRNVDVKFRQLDRVGTFTHLKPAPGTREGDDNVQPDAFALQPTMGIEAAWFNIKSYADMTVEELEVPLTVIRSDAATDLSGIAIVAKTLPLLEYTRERQGHFAAAEADLAALILTVGGTAYENGAELLVAAAGDRLEVIWPEPQIPMPTPERDAADAAELDMGLTDPIEVLARRRGVTLEEAEGIARAVANRRKLWETIMSDIRPEDPGGAKPGTGDAADDTESDTEGDDGEGTDGDE